LPTSYAHERKILHFIEVFFKMLYKKLLKYIKNSLFNICFKWLNYSALAQSASSRVKLSSYASYTSETMVFGQSTFWILENKNSRNKIRTLCSAFYEETKSFYTF
jgi:hypothetical protein